MLSYQICLLLLLVGFHCETGQTTFNIFIVVFGLLFKKVGLLLQPLHVLLQLAQFLLPSLPVYPLISDILGKQIKMNTKCKKP